jgi:uncharacterized cupredoxin-like copper-binding protein
VTTRQRIAALVLTAGVCAAAPLAGSAGVRAAAAAHPTCLHPHVTTIKVSEFEYGFTFSPKGAVPCGKVTFKQKNTGSAQHNFNLQGVKSGALIAPGGSTTFTIKVLKPGKYDYACDVLGHASLGMTGTLTVKQNTK